MSITALTSVKELLGGESFPKCESPSLRLEKFVRLEKKIKHQEIDAVVKCQSQYARATQAPKPTGAITLTAKLGGRLIINQAGGVLENAGMRLHRHFGVPYIPGSAVKGIARHAAWCEWNESEDADTKLACAKKLHKVFGYPTGDKSLDDYLKSAGCDQTHSGTVSFMPAYPKTKASLVTDIVTCHHPKYYRGEEDSFKGAPDTESPNPQFFPAVEAGCEFVFTLVPIRGGDVAQAKKWLANAITIYGAGGKTSAGYGWFDYDAEVEKTNADREAELAKQAAEKKAQEENQKRLTEEKKAEKERKANLTPEDLLLEQWAKNSDKWIYENLKNFEKKMSDAQKRTVVIILRMESGKGAEVWSQVKGTTDRRLKPSIDAIRGYCRNTMNLGKMP